MKFSSSSLVLPTVAETSKPADTRAPIIKNVPKIKINLKLLKKIQIYLEQNFLS